MSFLGFSQVYLYWLHTNCLEKNDQKSNWNYSHGTTSVFNAINSDAQYCRDANLANRFAVFLGLKISILDEKTVFSLIVQYTCVVVNLEKNSIFLNPAVFSSKNSTKYCKKGTLGISGTAILWQKEASDKSDILFKRATCVCHFHWCQWNIMVSCLTYLLAGWVFMNNIWPGRRAHWVKIQKHQ